VIAAKLANMTRGGIRPGQNTKTSQIANLQFEGEISQSTAAELLNVSPRLVAAVKAVERAAPELVEKIERGEAKASAPSLPQSWQR